MVDPFRWKRRKEQFYCDVDGGGCGRYFKTYLSRNMNGNYTIQCPNKNCNHHHFRVITEGLVTRDRHYSRDVGQTEIIVGLASTLSETPDLELEKANLKLYNGGISANP